MKANILKIGTLLGVSAMVLMSFTMMKNPNPWMAPKSANALVNPNKDSNPTAIKNGQKTFKLYCVACHGNKGKGDGIAGSSLNPRPANLLSKKVYTESDGAIFWKITNGNSPMPSWKAAIPAAKRWELVTYIRHLETKYAKGYAAK